METSFLSYYKIILEKVSFDNALLAKEYKKALQFIHPNETEVLNQWLESSGYLQRLQYAGQV